MKQPQRRESPIIAVLLCAVLVVLWIMFAPMQFGGRTSYVVVNGNSMEPKFHKGDLALVRKSDSYNVGDIVVYRHPTIGPIIHRVIGKEGDHYTFQGDNNNFVDSYHPTQAELIGKFWFHIPMVGQPFTKLHNRLVVAGLVALSGLIVLLPFALGESKTGRRKTKRSHEERREPAMNTQSENGQTLLTLLVAVALASLVLGSLALIRPLDRSVTKTADYQQAGTFSYSAPAPNGVYDADGVTTGDPIFTQITNNVDFRFAYELTSKQSADVSGTAGMQAVVSDSSGWKRSLQLLPPQSFTGTRFIAIGTLDLSQVRDVIKQFEQTTGITSHQYSVSIVPQAQLHGTIAGAKLETTYGPALKFMLDQDSMSLVDSSSSSDASAGSPLKPSQSGQVNYATQAPNVLSLLTFSLSVSTARIAALFGLIISLFGLAWYGLLALHGSRADEASRIKARYSALLVDVDDANFENTSRVIDVVRFEDLLRLAEREERMIMHQFYGGIDRYYVPDDAITYRYRVAPRSEPTSDGRSRAHLATGDLR